MLKVRAQANRDGFMSYENAVRALYKEGGIPALYRGFWPTFAREVPAWAGYFWCYEFLKDAWNVDKEIESNGGSHSKWTLFKAMVAGGLAG